MMVKVQQPGKNFDTREGEFLIGKKVGYLTCTRNIFMLFICSKRREGRILAGYSYWMVGVVEVFS